MKTDPEIENLKKLSENAIQAISNYKQGKIEEDFYKIRIRNLIDYNNHSKNAYFILIKSLYCAAVRNQIFIIISQPVNDNIDSQRMKRKILNHE